MAGGWDANARAWIAFLDQDRHREGLLDGAVDTALGTVRARRVLDVGSGEGRLTRRLAAKGAALVVGVDTSSRLVREARRRARSLSQKTRERLRYHVADAARLGNFSSASFDVVVSYLSWMHFGDAGRAAREWARVLAPEGHFVAVLPHPFTQAPGALWQVAEPPVAGSARPRRLAFVAGRYFEPARVGFRFGPEFPARTWNWHRSLSEWTEHLRGAGLVLERVWEPRPTAAQVRGDPAWEPYRLQPYFLVLRARRPVC